eukprot:766806-Hanusia_phi.AAC.2
MLRVSRAQRSPPLPPPRLESSCLGAHGRTGSPSSAVQRLAVPERQRSVCRSHQVIQTLRLLPELAAPCARAVRIASSLGCLAGLASRTGAEPV